MNLVDLKNYKESDNHFAVRVVAHSGSRYYQIMIEPDGGNAQTLTRNGKPMMFRNLDDVYCELRQADIHQAYLMHQVANDELNEDARHYQTHDTRLNLTF